MRINGLRWNKKKESHGPVLKKRRRGGYIERSYRDQYTQVWVARSCPRKKAAYRGRPGRSWYFGSFLRLVPMPGDWGHWWGDQAGPSETRAHITHKTDMIGPTSIMTGNTKTNISHPISKVGSCLRGDGWSLEGFLRRLVIAHSRSHFNMERVPSNSKGSLLFSEEIDQEGDQEGGHPWKLMHELERELVHHGEEDGEDEDEEISIDPKLVLRQARLIEVESYLWSPHQSLSSSAVSLSPNYELTLSIRHDEGRRSWILSDRSHLLTPPHTPSRLHHPDRDSRTVDPIERFELDNRMISCLRIHNTLT